METTLISPAELAGIMVRVLNTAIGPVADHDGGGPSFTFATPATGQLFTVTVTDALTRQEDPS